MSEFDQIQGDDQWKAKLQELLQAAKTAASGDDLDARFKVSDRLTAFILHSRPNNPTISVLDRIAGDAANDLMLHTINERLAGIASRNAALAAAGKQLASAQSALKAEAAAIRLTKVKTTVDSITATVHALKDLRTTLQDEKHEELGTKVTEAIAALQTLRESVDKAP